MRFYLLSLLLLFIHSPSLAQKEANIWYYGQKAGLDFNILPPKALFDSPIVSQESSAVIANKQTGDLLFYTDGTKVWNKFHQLMPNGNGLLAAPTTSTQGALIVPFPENDNLYYIFTVATPTYFNFTSPGLFYSLVDMKLNGTSGDVITTAKNLPLLAEVTEKLTAVRHQNGKDYWIIVHGWNNNLFYVYLVNNKGISGPNSFLSGTTYKDSTEFNSAAGGYLKASPDGKYLASAVYVEKKTLPFELYNFNASTGEISNYKNLGNFRSQYGVSFSPDNSKLYLSLTRVAADSTICQFDLSNIKSDGSIPFEYLKYQVVTGTNPNQGGSDPNSVKEIPLSWALELGPDGKLYSSSPYVINHPNAKGDSCLITQLNPILNDKPNRGFNLGLPNFIQNTFNNLPVKNGSNIPIEDCSAQQFVNLYPNPTINRSTIELTKGCQTSFSCWVYNSLGQLLIGPITNSNSIIIDLSNYSAGYYFMEIKVGQQRNVLKVLKL